MILRNAVVCIVMYFLARAAFAAPVEGANVAPSRVVATELKKSRLPAQVDRSECEGRGVTPEEKKKAEDTLIEFRGAGFFINGKPAAGFLIRNSDDTYHPWLTVGGPPGGAQWALISFNNKEARLCRDGVEKVVPLMGLRFGDVAFANPMSVDEVICRLKTGSRDAQENLKNPSYTFNSDTGELTIFSDEKPVVPDPKTVAALAERKVIDDFRSTLVAQQIEIGSGNPYRQEELAKDAEALDEYQSEVMQKIEKRGQVTIQEVLSSDDFHHFQRSEGPMLNRLGPMSFQMLLDLFAAARHACVQPKVSKDRKQMTIDDIAQFERMTTYSVGGTHPMNYRVFMNAAETILVDPWGGIVKRTSLKRGEASSSSVSAPVRRGAK